MATNYLRDQVDLVFSDSSPGEAEAYLTDLKKSWSDISTAIGRNALWLLLLITGFIILTRPSAVAEVSIGPLKIKDLSLVEKLLPILVAYQFS